MLKIDIPQIGIDRIAPVLEIREVKFNRARTLLRERNELLASLVHPLGEHMGKIVTEFNKPPVPNLKHELADGQTRPIHFPFFKDGVGKSIFALWFGKDADVDAIQQDPTKRPVLKAALYGFNKLKIIDVSGHASLRTRKGKIGDVEKPVYQIHTHVEVPFVLDKLGLVNRSDFLDIALGVNHDTTEEGVRALVDTDGIRHAEPVNTASLIRLLPENDLGRKLAMGIQILTESEIKDIEREMPDVMKDLRKAKITVGDNRTVEDVYAGIKVKTNQADKHIKEHVVEGPLKYGGLALQVRKFAEKAMNGELSRISGLSPQESRRLAQAAINVELADRVGDMAGLTRVVAAEDLTPEYKKERVMLYAARMLNMMEKLQDATRLIQPGRMSKPIFSFYKQILEVQLAQVNEEFRKRHILDGEGNAMHIFSQEMTEYYWGTARPIQVQADRLMEDFTERKVNRIIRTISAVK